MAEITIESINAKLEKEALTPEENKFVMSLPPDNASDGNRTSVEEEEIVWPEKVEGEETPEEKAAIEKKKQN